MGGLDLQGPMPGAEVHVVYSVPFSVPALYFLAWSLEGGVPFPQPVNGVSKLFPKLIVRALSLLSHPRLQPSPSFLTPQNEQTHRMGDLPEQENK